MLRLVTPRLVLRPPQVEDAPAIQAIASRREVAEMTAAIPHPYPEGGALAFIESLEQPSADGPDYHVVLERRVDGLVIGLAGLFPNPGAAHGQLGYYVDPAHWRFGYATEAAGALVRYAFDELRLARLNAHVFVGNDASMRVLAKLGFVAGGEFETDEPPRGPRRVALFERPRDP